MAKLVVVLMLLLLALAGGLLLRSAYLAFGKPIEMMRWQRACCIGSLIGGLLAWLSSLAIVAVFYLAAIEAGVRWFPVTGVAEFGSAVTPLALVLGWASRRRPGYLVAGAEAVQAAFWVVGWVIALTTA